MPLRFCIAFIVLFHTFGHVAESTREKNWYCSNLEEARCCEYKFSQPNIPILSLPTREGTINPNNPIVLSTGRPMPSHYSCGVSSVEYMNDTKGWSQDWYDSEGHVQHGMQVFYISASMINVDFEEYHAGIQTALANRLVRLNISCSPGVSGCMLFWVDSGVPIAQSGICLPMNTSEWSSVDEPSEAEELEEEEDEDEDEEFAHWKPNLPCCLFKFEWPELPVFKLHGLNSKRGDYPLELNPDNKMVYRWGSPIPDSEGCQGTEVDYLNQAGKWINSWNLRSSRGEQISGNFSLFFGNRSTLWMRELDQATGSQQLESLSGKLIRMQIECASYRGCVLFSLNGGRKISFLPPCASSNASLPIDGTPNPVVWRGNGPRECSNVQLPPAVSAPLVDDSPPVPMSPSIPPSIAGTIPIAVESTPSTASSPGAAPASSTPVTLPGPPTRPKPDWPTSISSHGATNCSQYQSRNASFHVIPPWNSSDCSINIVKFDFSCRSDSVLYISAMKLHLWARLAHSQADRSVCLRVSSVRKPISTDDSELMHGICSCADGDDMDFMALRQKYPAISTSRRCFAGERRENKPNQSDDDHFQRDAPSAVSSPPSAPPSHENNARCSSDGQLMEVGYIVVNLSSENDVEVIVPLDYKQLDLVNLPAFDLLIEQCNLTSSDRVAPFEGAVLLHSRSSDLSLVPRLEIAQEASSTFERLHLCVFNRDCTNSLCVERDNGLSGYCSCNSGWFTPMCLLRASPLCAAQWITPDKFAADGPPKMHVSVRFQCASLKILVQSPMVTGRLSTEITFNNNNSALCSYPGRMWWKNINNTGCIEQWMSHIPWDIARNCAEWVVTEEPDWTIWTTYLVIKHLDQQGSKSTEHVVPVQVKFPRSIKCDTRLNVTAPSVVDAAITEQSMFYEQLTATFRGLIRFFVVLSHPNYEVKSWRYISGPRGIPATLFVEKLNRSVDCVGSSSAGCKQRFSLQLNPLPDTCEITGTYVIKLDVGCQLTTSHSLCPLSAFSAQRVVLLTLSLVSERFCGLADLDVGISSSMRSFSDVTVSNPATSFVEDSVAFFRAKVIAESDLSSTKITELWVSRFTPSGTATAPLALWTIKGITNEGSSASFRIHSEGADYVIFSFVPSKLLSRRHHPGITITASLSVTYFFQSVGSMSFKRRSILEFQTTTSPEEFSSATQQVTNPTHSISVRLANSVAAPVAVEEGVGKNVSARAQSSSHADVVFPELFFLLLTIMVALL